MKRQPLNVFYCGKKASVWCGYILRGNKKITAGWCFRHEPNRNLVRLVGFYGHWISWMGVNEEYLETGKEEK